jgi:integrase
VTVFDKKTAGLGLVVFPSGIRSFFHLRFVRGYPKRVTIGRFPETTVENARGKASEINAAYSQWKMSGYRGEPPFESKRDPTLDELATQYVEKHIRSKASHPEQAAKSANWQFKKYLGAWCERRVGSISRADVHELHDRIGRKNGKHTANRTVQLLRAIFYRAEKEELWQGINPAKGIELFAESKRKRFLQPNELPQFFSALAAETNIDLRDFVNLAMWTGARRGDILSMRWSDIFLDDNRWQVPHPKNAQPYDVPLTPEAIEILRNRRRRHVEGTMWVFPSRGRTGHVVDLKVAWRKLLEKAELDGLRQHDLRRTLGSYQALQGTSLTIIGGSLGHKSLAATQVYAQINLDPVRASVMSATRTIIAASKKKQPPPRPPHKTPKRLKASRA